MVKDRFYGVSGLSEIGHCVLGWQNPEQNGKRGCAQISKIPVYGSVLEEFVWLSFKVTRLCSRMAKSRFTAQFWKSFQKAMGTQLSMCTAFHPQTDGHLEWTIKILEDMLRACVLDLKGSWEEHLPW